MPHWKSLFTLIALVTFPLFIIQWAFAAPPPPQGTSPWESIGPDGGTVYDITVSPHDPNLLYAYSVAGISRSTNGGEAWQLILGWYTPDGGYVQGAVAVDPHDPNHLIVPSGKSGMLNRFFLESTDGGTTWTRPTSVSYIRQVIFHPTIVGTMYVITGDNPYLYRTIDGGDTWQPIPLPDNEVVGNLIIHPTTPNKIYLAGEYDNIYLSTDGGSSWTIQSTTSLDLAVFDPTTTTLYGFTYNAIFKSTDEGVTWQGFSSGLPDDPFIMDDLTIDPQNPARLYASLVFHDFNPDSDSDYNIIYRTTGTKLEWEATTTALPNAPPNGGGDLLVASTTPSTIYYGNNRIYKSTDEATSWQLSDNGIRALALRDIEADPISPTHIYAAGLNHLYRTSDGGATWLTSLPNTLNTYLHQIVIAPSSPDTLLVSSTSHGIFRSTDSGDTWSPANIGLPSPEGFYAPAVDMEFHPTDPDIAVAVLGYRRIYRSTTGGASWSSAYLGEQGYEAAFDPSNPDVVWVVGMGTILKSVDAGASFAPITSTGIPEDAWIRSIAIHPTNSDILYVGIAGPGTVYRSIDGGVTWTPAPLGVSGYATTFDLWIDPITPDTVVAALNYTFPGYWEIEDPIGLYRTTDGGDSWHPYNDGLLNPAVTNLTGSGHTLFASTYGASIWANSDLPPTPTPNATTVPPTTTPTRTTVPSIPTATQAPPTATNTPTAPPPPKLYLPLVRR